jgi:hypothetical protein
LNTHRKHYNLKLLAKIYFTSRFFFGSQAIFFEPLFEEVQLTVTDADIKINIIEIVVFISCIHIEEGANRRTGRVIIKNGRLFLREPRI